MSPIKFTIVVFLGKGEVCELKRLIAWIRVKYIYIWYMPILIDSIHDLVLHVDDSNDGND
jgi:hypothetical protein